MVLDRALLNASWRSWYASDLRVVGPRWLQPVWTFVFSIVVGLGFFLLGLGFSVMGSGRWPNGANLLRWLMSNWAIALTVGFTIHGLFALAQAVVGVDRIRRFSNPMRGLFFSSVPVIGVLIGWPLGAWLVGAPGWSPLDRPIAVVASLLMSMLICAIFYLHFDAKARQFEAEKRATEAQLRLLQGQMEPHFMFNTLATVQTLIECDAPKAQQMLGAFIDYLRASLSHLRDGDSTLADELAMAEAYLGLMQTRMGERLRFSIDVADPALRRTTLPPLMLQPLVENAIHHGLECKVEGGVVALRVRRDGERLVVEVEDNGLGECERPARRTGAGATIAGNGVALDNLRARLRGRYGSAASLALLLRPDAGALATLSLPLDNALADGAAA